MSASALRRLVLALSAFALTAPTALAGTLAWTIDTDMVRAGPGPRYDDVGAISPGMPVTVNRCSGLWCQLDLPGTDGWVRKDQLSFGQFARGKLTGPKIFTNNGGADEVCFYDGANYTGRMVCAEPGRVVSDLAKAGRDNSISSISVSGRATALVCRDADFASACTSFVVSAPNLDRYLNNAVSSWQVFVHRAQAGENDLGAL